MRQRLDWRMRFLEVLPKVDPLFELLAEIAGQFDRNEVLGLHAECVTALSLWREYQGVMNGAGAPWDEWECALWKREARLDRSVELMLDAGAAGQGPDEIRKRFGIRSAGD